VDLTRLSGFGTSNISITINKGKLKNATWKPAEQPKVYRAMLAGMRWENVPYVGARICGSCYIGHTLACIAAIEDAFEIRPSLDTLNLRKLLKHMELMSGHLNNIYPNTRATSHPGPCSGIPLIGNHPETVRKATRLKVLAADATEVLGGGRAHTCSLEVGGFAVVPPKTELEILRKRLEGALDDLAETGAILDSLDIPEFETDTQFMSLSLMEAGEYPLMTCGMDGEYDINAGAEYSKTGRRSGNGNSSDGAGCFAMGALARVNNNFIYLHPEARRLSKSLGLYPVNRNPFMSNIARIVECVHVVKGSLGIIEELLDSGYEQSRADINPREGVGTGAVEAPTGIIRHTYEFNGRGEVVRSDCLMPVGLGYNHIRHDLEKLVGQYAGLGKSDEEMENLAHVLVKAWDPCISCAH